MKKLIDALSRIKNVFCLKQNIDTCMGVDIMDAAKSTRNAKGVGHEGNHFGIWWRSQ